MSANLDQNTRPTVVGRGLTVNHSETVLGAARVRRGIGTNHSETVLQAPRVLRGININHSETVLRASRVKGSAKRNPGARTSCMG
jgi:hypothetical protein